ncbi:hypothetical protein AHIS1636_14240 [Arthrobacter mangrovi]|uniref:Uncharacterized protein n=1 Tax=Arthrobacter mangrovi TaxID=2966350 RepID=A0ABQ5MT99_9MICC|nr:hypothetical protein AHIS1636_14240 [Arthrobacter mangrovi]
MLSVPGNPRRNAVQVARGKHRSAPSIPSAAGQARAQAALGRYAGAPLPISRMRSRTAAAVTFSPSRFGFPAPW